MFAFLLRFAGCLVFAVATAFAAGDVARSLAAEALRLTSVAEALALLGAGPLPGAESGLGGELLALAAGWPVSPTLAAIALLLLMLGRRRRHPALQR